MKLRIRKVERGDIEVVSGFLYAMTREMASFGGHTVIGERMATAWFRDRIADVIQNPDHLLLAAEFEEAPADPLGVIEASITQLHPVFRRKQMLHIHSIYVRPAHRRQGIGSQLMEAALQWGRAKHCVEAELSSLVGNPARALYDRLGFRVFELELRRNL